MSLKLDAMDSKALAKVVTDQVMRDMIAGESLLLSVSGIP